MLAVHSASPPAQPYLTGGRGEVKGGGVRGMNEKNNIAPFPSDKKRLAVIIPYRDRLDHLRQFAPCLQNYLIQDPICQSIDVEFHLVEQYGVESFNRGFLKNVGSRLAARNCDYFCFHDIDYLPINADYSWSDKPTRLIWHGLTLREDYDAFFGGVIIIPRSVFLRVNGYPNCYWGWGPEDLELALRCRSRGFEIAKRDGVYQSLPHKHNGFIAQGVYTDEATSTSKVFFERQSSFSEWIDRDGVNNARFTLKWSDPLSVDGVEFPNWRHHLVKLGGQP